jgi:hypothetical protein
MIENKYKKPKLKKKRKEEIRKDGHDNEENGIKIK